MTDRERIEEALAREGFTAQEWIEHPDNGLTAVVGRFVVQTDDEDAGLYGGDEGKLDACVVGAEQYANQRVSWTFTAEGYDEGNEVTDLSVLEPV